MRMPIPVSRAVLALAALVAAAPCVSAAETDSPTARNTTSIAIALATPDNVPVKSSFDASSSTIVIRFPRRRVTASLPERVSVASGAIQAIEADYGAGRSGQSGRFVNSVRIILNGAFPYRVRSEAGRVVVEIDHPLTVGGASMEVGMGSGQVVRNAPAASVSARFRAMQEALARARPVSVTIPIPPSPELMDGTAPADADMGAASADAPPAAPAAPSRPAVPAAALILLSSLTLAAAGTWWLVQRPLERAGIGHSIRLPSGVLLIDQLVWKAFERQHYQLIEEHELTHPPLGTLRIIAKDGAKSALLFVAAGRFFEKQTVERFVKAMRESRVERGFLAASGSFTIPAQRVAKERGITLIGRDELVELLSMGAGSEYFSRQLEQSRVQLEEARHTARQYSVELDILRRQRNEASWHLGEERTKSAALETRLEELAEEVRKYEADLQRWEAEAESLRKQWDESQWYLGEARQRNQYMESQVESFQELTRRVEAIERERDEALGALAGERAKETAFAWRVEELERELEAARARSVMLETSLARLQEDLSTYRTLGDRRQTGRVLIPEGTVELTNGNHHNGAAMLYDVSETGVGLESEGALPDKTPVRLRVCVAGRKAFEASGRVVWQRPHGSSGRYRSGCRLTRPAAATRAALAALLNQAPSGA
jgi:hypothetical protein